MADHVNWGGPADDPYRRNPSGSGSGGGRGGGGAGQPGGCAVVIAAAITGAGALGAITARARGWA